MLYVGIPEYRLPKSVLQREVAFIEAEGVEIRYNQAVGRDVAFADLARHGLRGHVHRHRRTLGQEAAHPR